MAIVRKLLARYRKNGVRTSVIIAALGYKKDKKGLSPSVYRILRELGAERDSGGYWRLTPSEAPKAKTEEAPVREVLKAGELMKSVMRLLEQHADAGGLTAEEIGAATARQHASIYDVLMRLGARRSGSRPARWLPPDGERPKRRLKATEAPRVIPPVDMLANAMRLGIEIAKIPDDELRELTQGMAALLALRGKHG